MKFKILLVLIGFVTALSCFAAPKNTFKFHQLFTDHAVFQRDTEKHPFRGYAPAGSKVEVHFRGKSAAATADEKGEWCVYLPTGDAGTGFELRAVCGDKVLVAKNIAVGEVWLVSGQSNAAFPLKKFKDGAEWAKDADYPQIRFQTQTWQPPHMRKDDSWCVLNEKTAMNFSATGFFFARELHKKQNVPVGVIVAAADGSIINKWIPEEALAQIPIAQEKVIKPFQRAKEAYPAKLKAYEAELERRKSLSAEEAAKLPKLRKPHPPVRLYSTLFNERVRRLAGLPVRGMIWYQGEADAMFAAGYVYRFYLEGLIASYRKHFQNAEMPFLVVEIPYFGHHYIWSDLRDSQKFVADRMKHVYLTSILDLSDLKDIHPPRKAELGTRLALMAEKFVYGRDGITATGPVYESMKVEDGKVILTFKADSIGGGLCSRDGAPLRGFQIAEKNGKFVPAEAVINGNTVVVSSPKIKAPAAVRYAWTPPQNGVNFYNKAGLPCGMFRTDNFKLPTEPERRK